MSTSVYSRFAAVDASEYTHWKQKVTLGPVTVVTQTLTLLITVLDYLYFNKNPPQG